MPIEQLGMQAANQAASNIMGIIMGGFNDDRQLAQQARLNEQNKGMIDYNYMKQLQMWKDTNYSAQIEQMKKAGLNPALIYGMSGGAGTTTGTGSGTQAPHAPQGGGELIAAQGMGIQYQLLEAQKELIKAQTEKTKGEAANLPATGEQIKTQTLDLLQGIENKKAQQTLTNVQTNLLRLEQELQGKTLQERIDRIKWESKSTHHQMGKLENEVYIQGKTMQDVITKVNAELAGMLLQNKAIGASIAQKWEALRIEGKKLTYIEWEAQIKQDMLDYQKAHPNLAQVLGGGVEQIAKGLWEILNQ